MVSAIYIPERGDIVWLEFDPQVGREQAGRRPALVLSRALYNGPVGLMIACPITSRIKNYPFEVQIPQGLQVGGVVLVDQMKSLDWRGRNAKFIDQLPAPVLQQVFSLVHTLV